MDDINRLNRLISDISDASRLDAELMRGEVKPVGRLKPHAPIIRSVADDKADAALRDRIARDGCALVRERFSPRATARLLMEIVDRHFGPARAEL